MIDQESTQEPPFSSRTIDCVGIPSDKVRTQMDSCAMPGVHFSLRGGLITISGSHSDHVEIAKEELEKWCSDTRKERQMSIGNSVSNKKTTEKQGTVDSSIADNERKHTNGVDKQPANARKEGLQNARKKRSNDSNAAAESCSNLEDRNLGIPMNKVPKRRQQSARKEGLQNERKKKSNENTATVSFSNPEDSNPMNEVTKGQQDPTSMCSLEVHIPQSVIPFKSLTERISERPQTPTFYVPGLSTALSRDCATYSLIYDSSSIVDYTKVLSEFTTFVQLETIGGVQKRGLLVDMAAKNMNGNIQFFKISPPLTQAFVRKSVVEGGVCKVFGRWSPIDDSSINEALEELLRNQEEIALIPLIG